MFRLKRWIRALLNPSSSDDPLQILELDTTARDAVFCADQTERFVNGEIPGGFGTLDWSEFLEV